MSGHMIVFLSAATCLALLRTAPALDIPWQKEEGKAPVPEQSGKSAMDSKANDQAANWRVAASHPKLDPALKNALDALKLSFTLNSNGVCRIKLAYEKERTHQVFISARKEEYLGAEFRKVWATALKSREAPAPEILQDLMKESAQKKIASWELQHWPDGYRIILAAKIPVDCSPKVLNAAIRLVGSVADKTEERLTGQDEF